MGTTGVPRNVSTILQMSANRKINGVSQVINNGLYITFAPSKNAEISMAFICEGVYGSSSLAQIAKPIYEYYFNSSQTAAAPQGENTLLG